MSSAKPSVNIPQPSSTDNDPLQPIKPERFPPEEEASLLSTSHAQKALANTLFTTAHYSEAIGTYDRALSSCPNYLEYEIAVLRSNISACYLKLEDWKEAVEAATGALEALGRLEPKKVDKEEGKGEGEGEGENGSGVVEISGEGEEGERELERLKMSDERREGVRRIRVKALMRRARGREEMGGWGNLAGAEEDYKQLAQIPNLPALDMTVVRRALSTLPLRISTAKEREMGEMMGKLKELGNGILKPFGLSTDMFKMEQDPGTGGYSMQFNQGR